MSLLAIPDGEQLSAEEYTTRFAEDFWQSGPTGFWKLERQQRFREPDSDSWRAFARGEWDRAIRRIEYRRPQLADYYRKISEHGFTARRARIVELPIVPYVQWELHLLRLRDELGGPVHILDADRVAEHEVNGQLPEVVVLGDEAMYQLLYDDTGLLAGGVRCTDRDAVQQWRTLIAGLFHRAERISVFFDREVEPLPPVETSQWR